MRHDRRRDRLRKWLKTQELPAVLVTDVHNVTYLSGFTGDSSYLLVTADEELFLTDSRYTTQVEEECPGLEYVTRTSATSMNAVLAKQVKKRRLTALGVEGDSLTKNGFDALEAALAGCELVATQGVIERQRAVKDRDEILEIRRSIQMAERAFEVIRASLTPNMTEREIAADLEHHIRKLGGAGCAFKPIIGVGPRAALPHGVPSERRVEEDPFVLIDWGARAGLYLSDLTRVLVTGKISAKFQKIYEVVLRAQLAAIAAIRPGVLCCEVDRAARAVIEEAGFGKRFGHGLGHGFGLQIHEEPRLSGSNSSELEPGMVVTVEPGIYLPGWGGVRLEDDVLVTPDGHEVLTTLPKDLESMQVPLSSIG